MLIVVSAKRWSRGLLLFMPGIILVVVGVAVLFATLIETNVCNGCPIVINGTSTCSCAAEYTENPAGWVMVVSGGLYTTAAWFGRIGGG